MKREVTFSPPRDRGEVCEIVPRPRRPRPHKVAKCHHLESIGVVEPDQRLGLSVVPLMLTVIVQGSAPAITDVGDSSERCEFRCNSRREAELFRRTRRIPARQFLRC